MGRRAMWITSALVAALASGWAPGAAGGAEPGRAEAACVSLATATTAADQTAAVVELRSTHHHRLHHILETWADDPVGGVPAVGRWCRARYPHNRTIRRAAFVPAPAATDDPPGFPRAVPVEAIADGRVRDHARTVSDGTGSVVEVGPGVYADAGYPVGGPATGFAPVFGLCTDVVKYRGQGNGNGITCW